MLHFYLLKLNIEHIVRKLLRQYKYLISLYEETQNSAESGN